MILYNTPLMMVLVFLGLILVLGLYVSKRATTFREYAVGNKRFHTNTLVATVLAMLFGGGSLMREVPNVYGFGMSRIVILFAMSVFFWIIGLLGLRMGPFMKHISVAETIGSVYGKYPRVIAAVLGICFSIGIVAIQINVIASAIGICIDSIDTRIVIVPATLILILYSIFGGVRSITITDILQFATFTIIIPLLVKFVFVKTGKSFLEIILILKKKEIFQLSNLLNFDKKLLQLFLDDLFSIFVLSPAVIQRVYMSSGPIQAYKVFFRVTIFSAIIMGCIMSIGLLIFVCNPTLSLIEIWPYLLADMSPAYKGCVAISLLGMTMSTADSNLHAAAVMFSHDIVETIRGVKTVSSMHQLRMAKLAVLVLGLLAMILTIYHTDLFKLIDFILTFLTPLFVVGVIPPFILAAFGFRSGARTVLIGMAIGISVGWAFEKLVKPEIGICFKFFPMVTNGLSMMAAHYLLPQSASKGWIGKDDQQKRMKNLIRAFKRYKKRIDLE